MKALKREKKKVLLVIEVLESEYYSPVDREEGKNVIFHIFPLNIFSLVFLPTVETETDLKSISIPSYNLKPVKPLSNC